MDMQRVGRSVFGIDGRRNVMTENHFDLAVVGGGPGGYAAAFKAADLGLKVALIDPEDNPGGVCLYRGCIPSKALLHVARLKKEAEEASKIGLIFGKAEIDLDKLREWKNSVVKELTSGLGQLSKQRKIEYIKGYASFSDDHILDITGNKKIDEISFDHAIIASGSQAITLPNVDPKMNNILFAEKALEIEELPEHLLIIGGGYIGLEMGTVYQSFGSKVTIVEMTSGFIPGADPDLTKVYHDSNKDFFEDLLFETKVTDIQESGNGLRVNFQDKKGNKDSKEYNKVMIAIGRKPFTKNIGLEKIGIKINKQGFISVDKQRRTSIDNIFAIGDVAGEPMLAHKASHEGIIAAEVIAGNSSIFEPRAIPAVVYTDPEIAWCGLMEHEAKDQGRKVKVVKFPWAASGRAKTLGRKDGLTKIIIDPNSERVLGMAIVGPHAGDLIAEGALAIEMAAVATDLMLTIHPHPTLSETVMEAAELFYGSSTHKFRKNGH
jgi:dihydrolipoamide dehydrogenase